MLAVEPAIGEGGGTLRERVRCDNPAIAAVLADWLG
jgi:hypothetical protein